MESREERERLGQRGAEKMHQDFSWDSVARRRLVHYREALDQRVPSSIVSTCKSTSAVE